RRRSRSDPDFCEQDGNHCAKKGNRGTAPDSASGKAVVIEIGQKTGWTTHVTPGTMPDCDDARTPTQRASSGSPLLMTTVTSSVLGKRDASHLRPAQPLLSRHCVF